MKDTYKLAVASVLTFLLPFVAPGDAQAQTCAQSTTCDTNQCRTPAKPAPSSLWGELKPAETAIDPDRDSTDHTGKESFNMTKPFWFNLDIEAGWIFAVGSSGFEVWDARNTPDHPVKLATIDGRRGGFPVFGASLEDKFPVQAIDVPDGDDTLLVIGAEKTVGLTIWSTVEKSSPRVLYQDYGSTLPREFVSVYAAKLAGRTYAFGADGSEGVRMYDMTKAATFTSPCLDESPASNCGVFLRRIGTQTFVREVSGTGDLISISGPRGVEVWNLSNPSSPALKGTWGSADIAYGQAMWSDANGGAYLGVIDNLGTFRIYNVSCAASGSCDPGAALSSVSTASTGYFTVSASKSGATPYIYIGQNGLCGSDLQAEWLFDVSNPGAPREIAPVHGLASGFLTDYWSWYHRATPTGFNWVFGQRAKFYGDNLYRAATGIFDIHKLGSAKPNPAFTWSPTKVFVGTPVSFLDQASGAPSSWTWTFQGGSPSTSFLRNPTGVVFSTVGAMTVSQSACNAFGCNELSKTITVEAPEAAVTGLTMSPASLTSCLTATFTATGVTGMDPIAYTWVVRPPTGSDIPLTTCTSNPCNWVVAPELVTGTYQVLVTVSNAQNPTGSTASQAFSLTQQTLGFTSGPTNDATTTGTVQFHVATTGAKEWAWDFGTGSGYGAYSTNPTSGPNPTYTYTVSSTYSVKVKIRDCNGIEMEYPAPLVINVTAIPLIASFEAYCFSGYCNFDTGQTVNFADLSSGNPQSWSYDWTHTGSDPNTCSFGIVYTAPQTTHTYTGAGTFQPCVKVTRGVDASVGVHVKTITVATYVPPPTPKVSLFGSASGLTGQPITFSASASNCTPAASGWRWSTGGGTGSSTSASISLTWSTIGTKTISVSNTSCGSASASKSVSITSGSSGTLAAQYTYSPAAPASGQAVSFNGAISTGSPTSYQWNFGDGTGNFDGAAISHTFASAGSYQVKLSVIKPGTGNGCFGGYCSDDEVKTVVVSGIATPPPTAAFIYSPTTVTAGKPVVFDGSSSTGSPTSYQWTFGDGTAAVTTVQAQHTFANAGSYQVKLSVTKPGSGTGCFGGFCSDDEIKTVVVGPPQTGLCEDDATALCLSNGRFKVKTEWTKPGAGGATGLGKPIGITDDTGYFWFEYASNVEVVTKVLDGCGVNGSRWVFAAGLTNIEVKMTVTDKVTGAVQTYINTQGNAFAPIQDTKAFSCTTASKIADIQWNPPVVASAEPTEWVEIQQGDPRPVGKPYIVSGTAELAPNATCVADVNALCLNNNRFRVEAWFATAENPYGRGQGVSLGGDTGYFWFFNKENVELIIKVLDGCALNSRYWVFAGGLTNVEVQIMVTDLMTGKFKEYVNQGGTPFPAYQDTDAISECF